MFKMYYRIVTSLTILLPTQTGSKLKTGYRKGDLNHIFTTEIFYLTISIKQTYKSFFK